MRDAKLIKSEVDGSRQNFNREGSAGFGLLETILVAAVVAVLVAVAVPQVSRALELQRLDTAAARVASMLMDARMNAIKRNTLGTLSINTGTQTMQVNCPGSTPVGWVETLPPGVTFNLSTPASVVFDSLGRLNTTAKTITLQSTSGSQKTVTISAAGKITINNMT